MSPVLNKMLRKLCAVILLNFIQLNNGAVFNRNEDSLFWQKVGMKQLRDNLDSTFSSCCNQNDVKAKNIIIFIGDGMGPTTVTAGRIYKGQLNGGTGEEETLNFEKFPYIGLAKTYNTDKQVPDSAGTATAIFTGVKTRYSVIGMDSTTISTNSEQGKLDSIMDWAIAANKRIGVVTTTRITHATPAALYANIYHRDWECDTEVPLVSRRIYKDIALQLIQDSPGNKFNVILGGGLSPLGDTNPNEMSTVKFEGETESICSRADGRNLTDEWLQSKPYNTSKLVKTRDDLLNIDPERIDYLMGIFRNNHITYSIAREPDEPSLSEMVQQAIRVLDRPNSNGFVLMVEGGRIDQAHHQNYAHAALQEVVEFDKAIELALTMTNPKETLFIVTADHSHSITLNGYPMRGSSILGFANKTGKDTPYETLTYANGPGFRDHRAYDYSTIDSNSDKINISWNTWIKVDEIDSQRRQSPTYRHLAALPLKDETHGGEDVAVYATGPGSNLIRSTFEQNYLAYVMSYVGCFGPAASLNKRCSESVEYDIINSTVDNDYNIKGNSMSIKIVSNPIIIVILSVFSCCLRM